MKSGDLVFFSTTNLNCIGQLIEDGEPIVITRELTPEILRGMGLVTLAEYDALKAKYEEVDKAAALMNGKLAQLYQIIIKDSYFEPMEPQPTHRFKVGDKVRILVGGYTNREGELKTPNQPEWGWKVQLSENNFNHYNAADLELIEAAPQPHEWKVGDYALCPDGVTRRVVEVHFVQLSFDDGSFADFADCTPCDEPEMPKLWSRDWKVMSNGLVQGDGVTNTLEKWIDFLTGLTGYEERLACLLALRDWRELTGRMV